ncbi:MAG: radical SAM protein [Candidatus Aminicenantes bacterium]|nr:radical SAM protein [Candidatus Aminicenantes bacterium]NIM82445.1 radical SAM protein [Candidatus Aminicenantes bacterium]NIN21806.1 radical SAM protein [Candidatus Aminicenantes bacterium]NIN45598.1 radical SAM protein [Candidatus Aminicenantes bacterium]NIN88429.1 radical SAM protein [Candidatus Aminicenantes bacterium]
MSKGNSKNLQKDDRQKEKILLVLLPFWTPLIPPLGISCLKSFVQNHGYNVKTVDLNVEMPFRNIYGKYYDRLKEHIPQNKRGNFYNTGLDVLQGHMMAYLNFEDEMEYLELLHLLIRNNFYADVGESCVLELDELIQTFYKELEKYFLRLLKDEEPAVLGLSVYRGTLPASIFAARLTREKYSHIKIVMGGAIFSQGLELSSPNFRFFLEKTPYIDKVIAGEGENLFVKFLHHELPESLNVCSIGSINGEFLDISSADIPDFSDFDLQHYPYNAAYTSRSCPFQCTFCAETVYWGKFRKKSCQQIIAELRELKEKYGSQLFLMCDSLLNPIIADLAGEFLKSDLLVYWDGYLRVDKNVSSIENSFLWRRAGFYRARLGVESGSQRILDAMDKKITPSSISSSIFSLARAGIKTTTYWIVGYPGETEEDFRQTLNLIEELKDYIYEAECNPYRYFLTGQVASTGLAEKNKAVPLYQENTRKMLITQTWILDCFPSRKETYERINRFEEHCKKLGIPNPYSLSDIYKADQRWSELHDNAVPSLMDIRNRNVSVDECRKVQKSSFVKAVVNDEGDFEF